MKKILFSMLAMAAMVSCTSENDPIDEAKDQPVEIKMNAGILNVATKAPIDATLTEDLSNITFLRFDGIQDATWDWSGTITTPTATISKTGMGITFSPVQYYPANENTYAHLIGYYPNTIFGNRTNGSIAISSFDGTQDIMYATEAKGNKKSSTLSISFAHKLSQVKFKFEKESSFDNTATISKVTIKGTKKPESMNLEDGTITYAITAENLDVNGSGFSIDNKNSGTEQGKTLIQAVPTNGDELTITLDIELSDGTKFSNVSVNGITKPEEGKAHVITLTFSQAAISATATIATWGEGTSGTGDVE